MCLRLFLHQYMCRHQLWMCFYVFLCVSVCFCVFLCVSVCFCVFLCVSVCFCVFPTMLPNPTALPPVIPIIIPYSMPHLYVCSLQGLEVKVWRDYDEFVAELTQCFPHEAAGIRSFYGECWRVFNALNSLELLSLEEPRYLLQQFSRNPLACLTLASFVTTNTGDVARRYIKVRDCW